MQTFNPCRLSRRSFLQYAACALTLSAASALAAAGENRVLILYFSRSGNTRALAEHIHSRVGGDMVERTKPAPDPWFRAMEFLGVDASQTIAIDDTAVGIGSAHAAGLYVVGFKGSEIAQDTSSADEELADFASFDLDRGLPRRTGR